MRIPGNLQRAIERETAKFPPDLLSRVTAELSRRYREGDERPPRFLSSEPQRAAYLVARLPAVYAAVSSVLQEIRRRLPELRLRSLLDLGAGPGTVMWAAAEVFPELERVTLVEKGAELIELGKRLARNSDHPSLARAAWRKFDLEEKIIPLPHDLVVISYVLGELKQRNRPSVIGTAWQAAGKILAIVGPGTRAGFSQISGARDALLAGGAHLIAPCPHSSPCPMSENDWCHFSVRVERSLAHRRAKRGSLGYEDEKFSYLIGAKIPGKSFAARLIRHPLIKPGHIRLDLCTRQGLQRRIVSRKDGEAYRRARKAAWGETWEER